MTAKEFNTKYFQWLETGHYGLDINALEMTSYLDKIFEDLTKLPGFKYTQIKIKFGRACFYTNLTTLYPNIGDLIVNHIEENLELILHSQMEENSWIIREEEILKQEEEVRATTEAKKKKAEEREQKLYLKLKEKLDKGLWVMRKYWIQK